MEVVTTALSLALLAVSWQHVSESEQKTSKPAFLSGRRGESHKPRGLAATGEHMRLARRRRRCTGAIGRDGTIHVDVVDSPNHGILEDQLDQDSLIELATHERGMPADADIFRTTCGRGLVVLPGDLGHELAFVTALDCRGRPTLGGNSGCQNDVC